MYECRKLEKSNGADQCGNNENREYLVELDSQMRRRSGDLHEQRNQAVKDYLATSEERDLEFF